MFFFTFNIFLDICGVALNLQPGHAYFVVSDADHSEIENRLRYEVLPLIKEYLLDGMLARAKDDFVNYFRKRINEEMFK